ncbi:MAG: DUF2235 domain-containing protein [Hymenobacter sp.]|nr:MAG: DUF2235 domain-containing protein [Hymenobacter sp.]
MATGFDHLLSIQQTGIGKGRVGEPPSPGDGQVGIKVKAAIFFDGTGNNQRNVTKRLKDSSYMEPHWYSKKTTWSDQALDNYDSYAQYFSNVAILYFMHDVHLPGEKIVSVYMEGIGTSNDGPDDVPGSGFGAGPAGVVGKVNRGIEKLVQQVKTKYKSSRKEYLEELTVCVFGFSRGAAAARHFCARRTNPRGRQSSLCQALGVPSSVVKIKFVGLFDSVSSFDETGEETPADPTDTSYVLKANRHRKANEGDKQFLNDVAELHLTLDDPTLGKVVHLMAADEYRLNFTSTTIASALQRCTGLEVKLPGAHSDVGGGYALRVVEDRKYGLGEVPRQLFDFFKNLGWYLPEQGTNQYEPSGDDEHPLPYILGHREIANTYQYVALHLMRKLAGLAHSGMRFSTPDQDKDQAEEERHIKCYLVPGTRLAAIQAQLEHFVLARYNETTSLTAPLPEAHYRWLRQHYLHLSWSDRTGFEYRKDAQGLPTRKSIVG